MLGVPSVETGGGPGVGCWYAESGWWRRLEKGCAERGADWVKMNAVACSNEVWDLVK